MKFSRKKFEQIQKFEEISSFFSRLIQNRKNQLNQLSI